jgi:hypothetical protein
MELYNGHWRQTARTHPAEVRCSVSKSFLYSHHVTYEDFLEFLKLHTLHDRRLHLDALFLISVCSGLKWCPSLLDTTGIRVPSRNVRNSSLFTATCTNSPTARRVTAANRACKDVDIFRKAVTSLKQFLCWNCTLLTFLTLNYLYLFRV